MANGDTSNGAARSGSLVLRWWPVAAFLATLMLAGLGAWGSTRSDIAVLQTKIEAHEMAQTNSDAARDARLERIENKLDRLLAASK